MSGDTSALRLGRADETLCLKRQRDESNHGDPGSGPVSSHVSRDVFIAAHFTAFNARQLSRACEASESARVAPRARSAEAERESPGPLRRRADRTRLNSRTLVQADGRSTTRSRNRLSRASPWQSKPCRIVCFAHVFEALVPSNPCRIVCCPCAANDPCHSLICPEH